MPRYELANEGCTTPTGEQAFKRYNELLRTQPNQLTQAIAILALNQNVPKEYQAAATAITDVLDTTNNGTQIGIGPDTEMGWAHVFDDESHREAQHYHSEQVQLVRELSYKLAQAKAEMETEDTPEPSMVDTISELETAYQQAVDELVARRRLRGMQTLRVVALLGGAKDLPLELPLAA